MDDDVNRQPLLHGKESESSEESDTFDEMGSDDCHIASKDALPLFKTREPVDRYNMAYIIFYLLGMTTLLPWCFFITADHYWMYKLRDVNETSDQPHANRTTMQAEFTAYLSIASTVPSTLVLVLNTCLSQRVSLQVRMVGSLVSIVVLFIMTTVFVKVDTDDWQVWFFVMTLGTVVVLNVASAVMGGGLFGIVGKFSSRYITAVVSGQALGGVVAAIAEIVALWLGASAVNSGFVYFMAANGILLLALVAYIVLARTLFFQYHMRDKCEVNGTIQNQLEVSNPRVICNRTILGKIWVYGLSVWMTFFVSLAVYPSVTVLINSVDKGNGRPWNDVYFVPVVGYLLFSTFDYIGRILAGLLLWPKKRGWILAVFSVARLVFIPLLLLCNAHPRKNLPVLIDSDLYYIILVVLFSLTNGYLANITMICAPKMVEPFEQETASTMMAAFLGVGLAFGSAAGLLMVKLL